MNVKNRTYQPPVMIEDPGMSDQSFDSVQPIGLPMQLDNGPFLYEKAPQQFQSKRYFNMPSESVLEKSRQAARKAPRVSQHPDMQAIRAQAKSAAKEIVAQSNIRHLRRELEPAIEKATEFVTTEAEPMNLNTILNPMQQVRPQFIQEDPTFIAQHLAAGAPPITIQQQYQMAQAQQSQRRQEELVDAQIRAAKAQEKLARQQTQAIQMAAMQQQQSYNQSSRSNKPIQAGAQKKYWVSPHDNRGTFIIDDTGSMTWKKLLEEWFFEQGDVARSFDASHPITQELMRDEGVKQVKQIWLASNKPKDLNKIFGSFN